MIKVVTITVDELEAIVHRAVSEEMDRRLGPSAVQQEQEEYLDTCKKQTFLQQFSEKLISAVFGKEDSAFWLDFFVVMSMKGRAVAVATATAFPGA